jgi:hypothetical protein
MGVRRGPGDCGGGGVANDSISPSTIHLLHALDALIGTRARVAGLAYGSAADQHNSVNCGTRAPPHQYTIFSSSSFLNLLPWTPF